MMKMHSNICQKVFFRQILLTLIMLIVPNLAQKSMEMFSLDKLVEYSNLVDCFTQIKDDFSACNKQAHRRGSIALQFIDESSSFGILLKCCGTWIVRDCWVSAATNKCPDSARDQLHNLPTKFMPAIDNVCKDYQPGSFYCYVPHLLVISAIIGALVLVGGAVAIAILVYRRRMRLKRKDWTKSSAGTGEQSNNNEKKASDV